MCVFEGDGSDGKIVGGVFGKRGGVFGSNDFVEGVGSNFEIIVVLLEVDVVDGVGFGLRRVVFGVYLKDEVFIVFFFFEDFKGSIFVVRGDDIVGDFFVNDFGGRDIDDVVKSDNVIEVVYVVGVMGMSVSLSKSRGFNVFDVVDEVDFVFIFGKWEVNGSICGGYVFEVGGSGKI